MPLLNCCFYSTEDVTDLEDAAALPFTQQAEAAQVLDCSITLSSTQSPPTRVLHEATPLIHAPLDTSHYCPCSYPIDHLCKSRPKCKSLLYKSRILTQYDVIKPFSQAVVHHSPHQCTNINLIFLLHVQ